MGYGAPKIKNRISIAVLGEKDHGKSTLIGRLLYETGSVPDDRIRAVKKAAKKTGSPIQWAHLLDSFRYEREKDMTLDTTSAIMESGSTEYELIDVPGHRALVKNMLSGASQAECAVLVVAADEGIRPQTIRHLEIAKFLGIARILAAVNKCDLIGYSREKYRQRERPLAELLRTWGFKSAMIVPVAARSGDNLALRGRRLGWFRGPTLLGVLEKIARQSTRAKTTPTAQKRVPLRKVFSAECILLKNPHTQKIVLEAGHRTREAKLDPGRKALFVGRPVPLTIRLAKGLAIDSVFVLKENGAIIGLGKPA